VLVLDLGIVVFPLNRGVGTDLQINYSLMDVCYQLSSQDLLSSKQGGARQWQSCQQSANYYKNKDQIPLK